MDESQWLSRKIQEELSKQQEALQGDYRNLVKQEEELLSTAKEVAGGGI
ncbi:hypothetical protein [Enterococcus rivorum]